MPPKMTSMDRGAAPILSAESLQRPLVDEETLHLWGNRGGRSSSVSLSDLERILQEGDEKERASAEAYIYILIFQAMQARLLDPHGGHLHRLGETLRDAVNRFNQYLR